MSLEDLLDERYIIRMVLLVDQKGEAILADFKEISKSTRTTTDVAWGLEKYGIFDIEAVSKPRKTVKIRLTKRGKEFAAALKKAVDAVKIS